MLRLNDLTFTSNGNKILDGITIEFKVGENTCLLGAPGSGKTSLLRCIGRLEPTDPRAITYKNIPIQALPPAEIGMVFQQFHLFSHLSVLENLCFSPLHLGVMTPQTCHTKAMEMLRRFGLEDKIDFQPPLLSGEQKQRVAIARALMLEPKILLFDEPSSALDPEMIDDVADLINSLKTPERTIIVATYDLRVCQKTADRVIFLDSGRVIEDSPATEFFTSPKSDRAKSFIQRAG